MGVPHIERNVGNDPEAMREFVEKAYEFLPTVEAGRSIITDYTGEPQLIEVLAAEGYLREGC